MLMDSGPAAAPAPGLPVFMTLLGRILAKFLAGRQHGDIIITFKDGKVTLVRIQTSYLPGSLPQV